MTKPILTPMGDKKKLESLVNTTPGFCKTVRFEDHPSREGYLLITDGSYSFGSITSEDLKRVLNDELTYNDIQGYPEVLNHVSCYDIQCNTRKYIKKTSQTSLAKIESKVSGFVPNQKSLLLLAVIVILAVAAPFLSSKIFSSASSGYSDDFYKSGLASARLKSFTYKWKRYVETRETYDAKRATLTAAEIRKFSKEVDNTRLTSEQRAMLTNLLTKVDEFRDNE